jgi:hypothetical protein
MTTLLNFFGARSGFERGDWIMIQIISQMIHAEPTHRVR